MPMICFAYTDHSIKKQSHKGTFNDEFDKVYEDVESYVKFAKEKMGFKRIILAGHSLGSNKIINYLGNTKDDFIDYFIISSPVDIMHWWNIMPNIDKCFDMAKSWVENNRGDDILPFLFGGFSPMTANTVIGFHNAGSKDSVTGDSPKKFMKTLNSWTKHPKLNRVIEIEGASHIFYNMHDIYANTILDCIQNHYMAAL